MVNFQGKATSGILLLCLCTTLVNSLRPAISIDVINSACKTKASSECINVVESIAVYTECWKREFRNCNRGFSALNRLSGHCVKVKKESIICYLDEDEVEQCFNAVYTIEQCSN
uniref:Cnidarian restricted protein n=1 Tax=Clytia hemisphaerica TaxID=252671 RepID=A0A7M6DNS7_9CNID